MQGITTKRGGVTDVSRPRLDVVQIKFPTDAITLGQMRDKESERFATDDFVSGHLQALSTRAIEYVLAEKAFAAALGLPDPVGHWHRAFIVELLGDAYREYGLSAGPHEDEQLARRIEGQAVEQAQRLKGPGAGR